MGVEIAVGVGAINNITKRLFVYLSGLIPCMVKSKFNLTNTQTSGFIKRFMMACFALSMVLGNMQN